MNDKNITIPIEEYRELLELKIRLEMLERLIKNAQYSFEVTKAVSIIFGYDYEERS